MKAKKFYVTYKWMLIGGYYSGPYAIECPSYEDMRDCACDIYSICGIHYVNLNQCGRLPKGTIIISWNDYKNDKYLDM